MLSNLEQYVTHALRTESPRQPLVHKDWTRILHAVLGWTSEASELLEEWLTYDASRMDKIIGELGDIWWFTAIAIQVAIEAGVTFEEITQSMETEITDAIELFEPDQILIPEHIAEFYIAIEPLVSTLKAKCFYSREPELENVMSQLNYAINAVGVLTVKIMDDLDIPNIETIWNANIAKLAKRYPEEYSDYLANSRNTDAEFEAIQEEIKE